jgi:phosphoribosylglycinamide formyltransferase-1
MLKLGFLASNNGSAMRAIVDAIATRRLCANACVVVSNKVDSAALPWARGRGISTHVIPTLPDAREADIALCEVFMAAGVNLVILSGYLRKLGPRTMEAFAGRVLNTHPALLPKFGGKGMFGRRVHEAVLAAGELETGATIHLADGEYDTGSIIAQRAVPIPTGADVAAVEELVMAAEASLFVETLIRIQAGELNFRICGPTTLSD